MKQEAIFESIRTAVSAEDERAAFERLREYVRENPGDREAQEILQQLDEGDWNAVRDRLAGHVESVPMGRERGYTETG